MNTAQTPPKTYQALFISDLHLSPHTEAINQLFFSYISKIAPQSQALYVLGDFFNLWIGDDDPEPFYSQVQTSLRTLVEQHQTRVYLMVGNRDFLLGSCWCQKAKISYLSDPSVVRLNEKSVLLSHGDGYCSDDVSYQRYRRLIRQSWLQNLFLKLPLSLRRKIATRIQAQSRHKQAQLSQPIDINQDTVQQFASQFGCQTLIHGHTHRLASHQEGDLQRWVLGDWRDSRATDLGISTSGDWQLHVYQPQDLA